MIPADSDNVIKEYQVLLNELNLYNPELLDKEKMLAITKSDLLDEELKIELKEELPEKINTVFISSVAQSGLTVLKDKIWKMIHNELV
jgi:GTP-binding protein